MSWAGMNLAWHGIYDTFGDVGWAVGEVIGGRSFTKELAVEGVECGSGWPQTGNFDFEVGRKRLMLKL